MLNRHQPNQRFDPTDHARCQALSPRQPSNLFQLGPAGRTANTPYRNLQPDAVLEQVTLSHAANSRVVDRKAVLMATTTTWMVIIRRMQSYQQGLGSNLGAGLNRESFPEKGKRISMHSDGGGPVGFVVLANSKLTGFTAVSYFFTLICEEPFFIAPIATLHSLACGGGYDKTRLFSILKTKQAILSCDIGTRPDAESLSA